ncbi:MAG: hypothetical protein V1765_03210 [bacterium]
MNKNRLKLNSVEKTLLSKNVSLITVADFAKFFNISMSTARLILSRYAKKEDSHFVRAKNGIYLFTLGNPEKFEIANKIFQPSYISFESALSYYNIIPETVYSITSATNKRPKEIIVQDINYKYYKLKNKLFFGYRTISIHQKKILIAEKEKALLDYIYLVSLKKIAFNQRIDLSKIDRDKLGYYTNYFLKNIKKDKIFLKTINSIYKNI